MINRAMFDWGVEPSVIRQLFAYGLQRKAEIGADKVFDYSIGNPSVPAPDAVKDTMLELLEEEPASLHGYSPAAGDPRVCAAIAKHLSKKFDITASPNLIYMTAGAAGGLAISIAAITNPGNEVIVISPYFPEYRTWIEAADCTCVEVPALEPSFMPNIDALRDAIGPKTSAIIVNSPNNPVGAVYTRESLEALAGLLREKEIELGHLIYLISDEPYREIVYGKEVPFIPSIYKRTIMCYSYSKALSLPGERIGYIYVSDSMEEASDIFTAVAGAGRALGYVCAPVLLQRTVAKCADVPSDVEAYRENRALLTQALSSFGYEYVEPDGAFYLWVKALEPDAKAFSEKAKEFELLIVPSDSFGTTGWVRLSYCVSKDMIERSLPAFKALKEAYRPQA